MSEPSGYLLHGTAFSSKEAAFEILVHNHEQELRFHKLWDKDAQPYYFESQPQLTIPKSIADDKVVKYAVEHPNLARFVINDILEGLAIDEYPIDYENVIKWIKPLINVDRDKLNVILAYLAGKALGVDLVKVV